MAAEPVIKYAAVFPTSINTPKASDTRIAKRIARSSLSSRCGAFRRDVIAVVSVESDSGAVSSSKVRVLPKVADLSIFHDVQGWGCDGTHRRPHSVRGGRDTGTPPRGLFYRSLS